MAVHISCGSCSAPPPSMNRVATGTARPRNRRSVHGDERDLGSAGAQVDCKHTFGRHAARLRRATPLVVNERADVERLVRESNLFADRDRRDPSTERRHHQSKLRRLDRPRRVRRAHSRASAPNCSASTAPTRPRPRSVPPNSASARRCSACWRRVGTLVTELVDGSSSRADAVRRAARRRRRPDPSISRQRSARRCVPDPSRRRVARARCVCSRGDGTEGVRASASAEPANRERHSLGSPTPLVPCHNDLLPGNVLFADDRVWLLDFEYAGMNDVFFDLGNLSVNSELESRSRRAAADAVLRSGHQVVVGSAATDEDDERVPRRHVGRRAASDQHARHRLRLVCQRQARQLRASGQSARVRRLAQPTRRIRSTEPDRLESKRWGRIPRSSPISRPTPVRP